MSDVRIVSGAPFSQLSPAKAISAILDGAMDKAQAAAFMSVSKRTLDELVRNGFSAPVNISGKGDSDRPRVVFRREELEQYLRRRQAKLGAM